MLSLSATLSALNRLPASLALNNILPLSATLVCYLMAGADALPAPHFAALWPTAYHPAKA
jgi:hypothetical protein